MHIEPLSAASLEQGINLANQIFPKEKPWERASWAFTLSLQENSIWSKIFFALLGITKVRYWVAVSENTGKVIGTTGLYSNVQDANEAYWLGWTCVSPNFQGQKIGSKLVDFSIEQARVEGKKFLRLYTLVSSHRSIAQILYEKRGFQPIGEDQVWGTKFKKQYLELPLHSDPLAITISK